MNRAIDLVTTVRLLSQENGELRRIIAELGYCTPHASLEFMRLIPEEVRATIAKAKGA